MLNWFKGLFKPDIVPEVTYIVRYIKYGILEDEYTVPVIAKELKEAEKTFFMYFNGSKVDVLDIVELEINSKTK